MAEWYSRSQLLLGEDGMARLKKARVVVFGIGGVGGYAVEALARAGVGAIDLVDDDKVCLTNLNRQIVALTSTVGRYKADVAAERIKDIAPDCAVSVSKVFFTPENSRSFDFSLYDYVVDAIDTVSGKIELIVRSKESGVPVISSMGAGNKLDPTAFKVADIKKTSVCPLAKVMRRELRRRGIDSLKVVYSEEVPVEVGYRDFFDGKDGSDAERGGKGRRVTPGSVSFVPSVAGLIIAGEVVKDLAFGRTVKGDVG